MKVRIDLHTPEGRAAMRAWLDVVDGREQRVEIAPRDDVVTIRAADFFTDAFAGQSSDAADEGPAEPPPAAEVQGELVGTPGTSPEPMVAPEGERTEDAGPGVVPLRCSGSAGADGRPQESLQANPGEPRPDPLNIESAVVHDAADPAAENLPAAPAAPEGFVPFTSGAVVGDAEVWLDPKRPWTSEERSRAWAMSQAGTTPPEIAKALRRDYKQVYNFIGHIRAGRVQPPPPLRQPGTALVAAEPAPSALALRDEDAGPRGFGAVAKDPELAAKWREEAAAGERTAFVKRTLYPAEGDAR